MNKLKEILHHKTDKAIVNVFHDKQSKNNNMLIEVWVKVRDGIRYTIQRRDMISNPVDYIDQWITEAINEGMFSPRPYKPGQACDGTISSTSTALFLAYCKHRKLNPLIIYRAAYPDERTTKKDLTAMQEFADWQGVDYPEVWDSETCSLMMDSLHNANHHNLANQLEEDLGI